MTLEQAGDELVDDGGNSFLNVKLQPLVHTKRFCEQISKQMKALRGAGLVVGWACSVSRGDGTEHHHDSGGDAIVAVSTPAFWEPPKGTRYATYHPAYERKAVKMCPDQPSIIGSCSKTITAISTIAAHWAGTTNFGANPLPFPFPSFQQVQEGSYDVPLWSRLPSTWDLSRIKRGGTFSNSPGNGKPGANVVGKHLKRDITLKHVLQHRAYLLRDDTSRYRSPDAVGFDDGYYENIKDAIRIGPAFKKGVFQPIGTGFGQYSNMGYNALRLAVAYLLASAPILTGAPSIQALNAVDPVTRDIVTSLLYVQFVKEYILKPCNVEGDVVPLGDIAYYNIDAYMNGTPTDLKDFEYIPTFNALLTAGASGWSLSADGLRRLLVGVQQGKPFGDDRSWWHDVIWKNWFGSDPPWLNRKAWTRAHPILPNGQKGRAYTKGGGFQAQLSDRGAKARAACGLMVTKDATATLLVNSGTFNKKLNIPSLVDVLGQAYLAAF